MTTPPHTRQTSETKPTEIKSETKNKPVKQLPLVVKKEPEEPPTKCCSNCKTTTPVAIDFTASYKSDSALLKTDNASTENTTNKGKTVNRKDKSPGMSIGGLLNDK